jgi:hypothetical protein
MTPHQGEEALDMMSLGSEQLCRELRDEFRRLGVELPALLPLSRSVAMTADDGRPSPLIWLGTCDDITGRLLLNVLRGCRS